MQIIGLIVVWLLLVMAMTMRFRIQGQYSDRERARLVAHGDRSALEETAHLEQIPLLQSLHTLITTLITAVFVAVSVFACGVVPGIMVAAVGMLLAPLMFRFPLVQSMADKLTQKVQPIFVVIVGHIRPILFALRDRDMSVAPPQLNSREELLSLLQQSPGVLTKDELTRLKAGLLFGDMSVCDVMTPRSMINGIAAHESLGPLVLDELYKTGHSRFPVYKKDFDHMVGMLYIHDLVDLKQTEKTVEQAMHKRVYYIHEQYTLARALAGFLRTKHHLFVVVNDYRETVGLLSLEDTLEALIGSEIVDEFDAYDDLRAVAEHNPRKNNLPTSRQDI